MVSEKTSDAIPDKAVDSDDHVPIQKLGVHLSNALAWVRVLVDGLGQGGAPYPHPVATGREQVTMCFLLRESEAVRG